MAVALIILFAALGFSVSTKNPNDLRPALDNPVALMQTVSSTLDQNENYGAFNRTQSVLDVAPVFYSVGDEWAWVHRPEIPFLQQPQSDENSDAYGLGDLSYRGFLTPKKHDKWIWGVGPWILFPTGTRSELTTGKYSVGPSMVLLYQEGPMSLGAVLSQAWSFAGDSDRDDVSILEAEPIVRMYVGQQTTISLLDTITLDWLADSKNKLTVPMGVEVRQLFKGTFVPIEAYVGVFGNVVRPEHSSDWYWKLGVNFVISK